MSKTTPQHHTSGSQEAGMWPTSVSAPTSGDKSVSKRREPRRPPPPPTDLAEVRRRKQRQRVRLSRAVDWYMDRADQVCLSVPMIYIYVACSVTAAAALFHIERLSEGQFLEKGDPWVHLDQASWLAETKLSEEEWLNARSELRELDLIEERRRFDLERDEIVTQIQFLPDAFVKAKAEVRDNIREQVRQAMERGEKVPGDIA